MDRSAITALIFIVTAALIAYVGIQYGDEIATSLPGGKATGIVAGVICLLGFFITAYKTIQSIEHNRLDEEGFRNLLEMHFGSVSHGLMHVFNDVLLEMESNPESVNKKLILINAKRVLDNSRNKLSPFTTHNISNVPDFLDKNFSPDALEKNIEEALAILNKTDGLGKKQKLAFQLIQRVQSDLLSVIQSSDYKI
jgi:hypothetical protein